MRKVNNLVSVVLGLAITISLFSGATKISASEIAVEIDGKQIDFDVAPQVVDDRTLVPLRGIFEEIGALVKWDDETQTVLARKNSKTVELTIDSNELRINKGERNSDGDLVYDTVELDVPAQLMSDRTMVPVRAISDAFGLDVYWNEDEQKVEISSKKDEDDSWKENKVNVNLSKLTYDGEGVDVSEGGILITKGGDYTLSGELKDASVTVSTDEKVKLRLSGVTITSDGEPCIYFENVDKAYITVSDSTENKLTTENCDSGAVYSKDNLEIKGKGNLEITSSGHGIKASDSLTIENGVINIDAIGDGIHVNDTFKMTGGTVKITAIGDGVDSESIVIVSGGSLDIETKGEPTEQISEESNTWKNDKDFDIKNDKDPGENDKRTQPNEEEAVPNGMDKMPMHGGMFEESSSVEFEKSTKGIKAEWMMSISGGEINVNSSHHAVHCGDEIEITGGKLTLDSRYGKGVSAHGDLTISNDDTEIDVKNSTEGLESKKTLTINGGVINIVASDDGINATGGNSGQMQGGGFGGGRPDGADVPGGGKREDGGADKMPDSRPSEKDSAMPRNEWDENTTPPNMEDGNIPPSDMQHEDMTPPEPPQGGMPGRQEGSMGARPTDAANGGNFGGSQKKMSDCLVINGGDIEIVAGDDCIDSNGNLILNGGVIKATRTGGTFTGPFAVLDPDGTISVNEGVTLVAVGSGGTQGNLDIPQNNITVYCEETHSAEDKITVKTSNGKIIAEYVPGGEYTAILITSPELKTGEKYEVSMGSETAEVNLESKDTVYGTRGGGDKAFGGEHRENGGKNSIFMNRGK